MGYRLAVWFAMSAPLVFAQTAAPFVVVNAASYSSTVAPDSFAAIFGGNLSQAKVSATLDANGQLPTQLGGTSVTINGVLAPLFYVSPTQINLVIPDGLIAGTATVIISTVSSNATRTATALLAIDAPAVFTNDASGTGAGAILNAVTAQSAPFQVQTPENGADPRTRLAVYGTGLRNATSVTAQAQDPSGNTYPLTVEYAGAAPGFFGLDQVNLVLPPDLDVAGSVSLTLYADRSAANVVTFQMSQIPQSELGLATLTVSPTFVIAGGTATLTVGLTGTARAGGYVVGLSSNNVAAAQVATPQIAIPAGSASATASINTFSLSATATATLMAQAGGVIQSTTLEVDPANTAQLSSLSVASTTILGGSTVTGTVTLSGTAPAGGVNVTLASDNAVAVPPKSVLVPFGQSSATFAIATTAVTSPETANLTATLNHTTSTAALSVLPAMQLTLDASSVVGGNSLNGTVTLGAPAPAGGAALTITSSDSSAARVSPFTIPAGQNTGSFPITTNTVTVQRTAIITVTYGQLTPQTASLTVTPPLVPTLTGLTISPATVTAGGNATGTVTLSSAALTNTSVSLATSSYTAAFITSPVTVAQGQISASFNITTVGKGVATITATLNGVKQTATLEVQ